MTAADLDLPALRRIAEAARAETIPPGPAASETFRAAFDPPAALALITSAEEVPRLTERLREAMRVIDDAASEFATIARSLPEGDTERYARACVERLAAFLANANSPSPDVVGEIAKWLRMNSLSQHSAEWRFGLGRRQCEELADFIERRDWRKEPT